jgi:hypothetical protein
MTDEPAPSAMPAEPTRFFERVDWAGFGLAFGLALAVYLFTLAPDVTLEYSGIYSASAMYPGDSIPPGHPIWEIYGWLFIHVLPFSNIAWRLGVSSAVAGALASGLIALMVSRVGIMAVAKVEGFDRLKEHEHKSLRVVCGLVAGLGFAFNGCFWPKAVVVDTWPLSLLLLTLSLCFLTRWFFRPDERRYLALAAFVLGLALCESQALIPAALGFPFVVAMGDRRLGRDFFLGMSVFLWGVVAAKSRWDKMGWTPFPSAWHLLIGITILTTILWIVPTILTQRLFTEWKTALLCAGLFLIAFGPDFLLPVFSMTDPVINWGYPRMAEGFFHTLSRGQFNAMDPAYSFHWLKVALIIYTSTTCDEFGLFYLLVAILPFLLLHKASGVARRWLLGLLIAWICITGLIVTVEHLTPEQSVVESEKFYFAATYIMLAIMAGCGLMLIGAYYARPMPAPTAMDERVESSVEDL